MPRSLELPSNLFVVGTVNVDETTYMFSRKVLDRANVIEFRMVSDEMANYLASPNAPDMAAICSRGQGFASAFVEAARKNVDVPDLLQTHLRSERQLFFESLKDHGAEFGYRVARDASRLVAFSDLLAAAEGGKRRSFHSYADAATR